MAQTGYMTLASAVDDLARSGFREHFQIKAGKLLALDSGKTFNAPELVIRAYHRFEGVSDPEVGVFLEGVPIRKAAQVGAFQAAQPRAVGRHGGTCMRRPTREPFVFGPRNHPVAVGPLAAATPRTARYDYGFQVPLSGDPWQDDGAED